MSGNYRALTRRYRPSTFDDIVSQEHVSSTLKNAIEKDRIAHAYMFCGPRGVGKTTMARVLARTINQVDAAVDGEALGNTLNIIEIDAASNNKVEDVHRIRESVRIPPQNGRFKVYIIDEVHMLSKSAFNALLKTLEEPPPHAIFIFATTEPHKVLPTILSRVQRFDFRRIKVEEIVAHLKNIAKEETIEIDEESLHVIAKKADGALRDALGLLDQAIAFCGDTIAHQDLLNALNVVGTDRLFEFTQAIISKDSRTGMQLFDALLQEGHDMQEFLVSLTEHFRNMYMAIDGENLNLIEASEETRKRYSEVTRAFSSQDILRFLHIVSDAQAKIKEAHQPRILCEITLLKLIKMERVSGLETLLKEIDLLKKKLNNTSALTTEESGTDYKETKKTHSKISKTESTQVTHPIQENSPASTSQSQQGGSLFGHIEPAIKNNPTRSQLRAVRKEEDEFKSNTSTSGKETETILGRYEGNLALAPTPQTKDQSEEERSNSELGTHTKENDAWLDTKMVTVEEIESIWELFLKTVEPKVNMTMNVFLGRCKVDSVKENIIYIQVSDPLGEKVIEQHKRTLAISFNEILESRVQVEARFVRDKNEEQQLDFYERFKLLQKKDPKVKSIIELFGAELIY